ncbi:MAG: hypothetical protein NC212_04080 [Staphylococcus sp.]|nr:hypothetical protein [Staphylococcus sp.]
MKKNTHTLRLCLAAAVGLSLSGALSSCEGLWMSTGTDFNFTQPGGFGIDLGISGPIGGPATPPPPPPPGGPGGPGGPPPGGPGWGW